MGVFKTVRLLSARLAKSVLDLALIFHVHSLPSQKVISEEAMKLNQVLFEKESEKKIT